MLRIPIFSFQFQLKLRIQEILVKSSQCKKFPNSLVQVLFALIVEYWLHDV
jgi:hypothetical protein